MYLNNPKTIPTLFVEKLISTNQSLVPESLGTTDSERLGQIQGQVANDHVNSCLFDSKPSN